MVGQGWQEAEKGENPNPAWAFGVTKAGESRELGVKPAGIDVTAEDAGGFTAEALGLSWVQYLPWLS